MLGAPPVNWARLFMVSAILLASIYAQNLMKLHLGWTFDLALAVLLVSALFLRFLELIFLILVGLIFLSVKPGWDTESFLILALPVATFFGERIFSWELWLTNLVFVASGILIFYVVLDMGQLLGNWLIILNDVVFSTFFAGGIFFVLEHIYRSQLD